MFKIKDLSSYKFKNGGFEPDVMNPRRIIILLIFILAIFSVFVSNHKDDLFEVFHPQETNFTQPKQKSLVTLEKYISSSTDMLSPEKVREYARLTLKYSNEYKIDPYMLIGLIKVESHFDRYAVSSVGALGLTQVMPEYHKDKIKKLVVRFGEFNPFNEEHNIALGAMIFAEYAKKYNSKEKALLQYNGSLHHSEPTYAKAVLKARHNAVKFEVKT